MKYIFILVAALFVSCKSQKTTAGALSSGYSIKSECPENYECTFETFKNQSLALEEDGTGKLFYTLKDTPGTMVVKYRYNKINIDPRLQDAGYFEEILFEADMDKALPALDGEAVQKTNMIFGVMCFCKGKAGYYRVNNGTIRFNDNRLFVEVPEIVEGQRVTSYNISFE